MSDQTTLEVVLSSESTVGNPIIQTVTVLGTVPIGPRGIDGVGGGGGVTDAAFLVTTAHADLSAEVVVGATPGGELGGTWASPTVDATHSGSSHAAVQAAAEATAAAALAAEATLARNADNLTSGTVADARIASTIARDSEVAAGYQPLDADLTALAAAGNSAVLAATTASFLTADETKLDGIEAGADVTDAANVNAAGAVMESDYDAHTILAATSDNTPVALSVAEQRLVGRITGGNIDDLTAAQVRTLLNVEDGATADQSAAEILAALLTVDGAGSGLDADLLDGQSSAAFATAAALTAHIDDTADAHDASAISIADAGNDFTATDVEGALAELQADHEADVTALSDHTGDTSGAHAASAISADSTTLVGTGTDVQAVLEELDNGIADHLADATAAHAATAIAFTPAGTIAATTVQAAIEEVASEAGGGSPGLLIESGSETKVSALTELTSFTGDETFYVVEDDDGTPVSRRVTVENLRAGILSAGWQLIDEDTVVVTSGSITLNTTSIADLTATQITLNGAQAGDVVYYEPSMLMSQAASTKAFDAYTYPSGTRTNPFGPGVSASLASTGGYSAWFHGGGTGHPELGRGGRARRVLVSGDIASGNVIVGLATAGTNTTARTLYAVANNPFQATAQLWRPPT